MRIAVLGFLHESNTFLSNPTSYADFARTTVTRGEAMIERWENAQHELGGMITVSREEGMSIAGGMAAIAIPSGTITSEAYEQIAGELLSSLRGAGYVDGVLMALHGATVSKHFPDADGELLRRVRQVVGPDLPIIVTLDLHANISPQMVKNSNAIICYRSNPHLDQRQRGQEATHLLARTLRGEVRPVQALAAPPLILQISQQYTEQSPASTLYSRLEEVLAWPGILSASVAMGFYYSDVEEMGASFLAVTDNNPALAQKAANWMAERAWQNRASFCTPLPDAAAAVRNATVSNNKPVVLLDIGDNVGGGSPADSTILLEEIQRQKVRNALVVLYDPEAVKLCVEARVRSSITLNVGGKTDSMHGAPVRIHGKIKTIADGIFTDPQVRHGGWGGGDQGVTVVVETEEQHTVVLTSERMAPMSLEQVLSLGVHPERKDILIVKGVVAPRAAYKPVAGEFVLVGTPGVTADDPRLFRYEHRRTPMYPLEPWAEYSATT